MAIATDSVQVAWWPGGNFFVAAFSHRYDDQLTPLCYQLMCNSLMSDE